MNQKTLQAKTEVIQEIIGLSEKSQSLVVVEYRGLNVSEISALRRTLKESSSQLIVFKNSMVARAAESLKYENLDEYLVGPNAFVFSPQTLDSAKVLVKYARRNDKLVIKGGVIEGKVYSGKEIKTLSTLPEKNGLLSMFLSCLQSPLSSLARTIQAVADTKQ